MFTRLVQQAKDVNSTKAAINSATTNKILAEYDNVVATRRLRDGVVTDAERVGALVRAGRGAETAPLVEGESQYNTTRQQYGTPPF